MVQDLSPGSLNLLTAEIAAELRRREAENPAGFFPWHDIQDWALHHVWDEAQKDVRIMLVCGGNRGGKSATGKGTYANVMRRTSPIAKKLQTVDKLTGEQRPKNDTDPITVWIVPPTLEKARQDWVNPSDGYGLKYWLGDLYIDEKKTPDHVFYSRPPGLSQEDANQAWVNGEYERFDKTIIKSHDQDLLSFEASAVDFCIFDEEIMEQAKWNSVLMRIGTTNGTVMMCYTPLHGLSWSFDRYWRPLIKNEVARKVRDRCWIHDQGRGACVVAVQFGAGDNPLAADYAHEIEHDHGMSEAEKAARLHGEYGFVEGALIPSLSGIDLLAPDSDHEVFVVDYLPGMAVRDRDRERYGDAIEGDIIEWLLVTDPNKSYGATLAGVDNNGNVFFVEWHLEVAWPDRLHAQAFEKMEKKWVKPRQPVRRMADPGSAGAQSIVNMGDYGLFFETMEKGAGSVSESIKRLRSLAWVDPEHRHPITGQMGAPRVYFYRPTLIKKWQAEGSGPGQETWNIGCKLTDQISMARQTDNENAPPDTPHKSHRSKLDLFDCARYTAMAVRLPKDEVPAGGTVARDDYTLPSLPLSGQEPYNPLDRDIFVPEYNWN